MYFENIWYYLYKANIFVIGGLIMIKFQVGLKGTGKTKKLIDAVNSAVSEEKGNIVCIIGGNRLMHDISRGVRMIDTEGFEITNFDMFSGMLYGIIAQNFDITHIFIDSLFKSVPNESVENIDKFIDTIEKLEKQFDVSFTVMVSIDISEATDKMKKYID